MTLPVVLAAALLLGCAAPGRAQEALPLEQALARARSANPTLAAATHAVEAATARITQATASRLPHVDVVETWQRGNAPLFAFGSRLAARALAPDDFVLGRLNEPDALTVFRTAASVQQLLFSPGRSARIDQARVEQQLAAADRDAAHRDLALAVTSAYAAVLAAEAGLQATVRAREAAEADAERTTARRDAGMATDADALALQVAAADLRAREARAEGDLDIARARLNRLMGAPLEARFALTEPVPPPVDLAEADAATTASLDERPDLRQARDAEALADAARRAALARLLPEVAATGGLDWTGLGFGDRRTSWVAGLEVRLNLYAGGADRARQREALARTAQAAAHRRAAEAAALESVRAATRQVRAARAEADARRDGAGQAREAERLVRERYDAGLATLTELLRASSASLEAEARAVHSRLDLVVSLVTLMHALGLPL
jgi:outer membrane protein